MSSIGRGVADFLGIEGEAPPPDDSLSIVANSMPWVVLVCLAGIGLSDRPSGQLKWAACGAALLFAVTVAMLGGIHAARDPGDSIRTGTWLTLVGGTDSRDARVMPASTSWRSERIDEIVGELIRTTGGKWLGAIAAGGDLPSGLRGGAHVEVTLLDPPAVSDDLWEEPFVLARQADFFAAGRLQREQFDGAYLSGLPADHPHAWRCYSRQVVKRFYGCVQRDGLVMMRITARSDSAGAALSAGRAFFKSVGPGWLVFDAQDDVADMLFVATIGRGDRPIPQTDLTVVSDGKLGDEWPGTRTMDLRRPGAGNRHRVDVRQLVRRLGSAN